jgi:hypothetical protein
MSGLRAARCEGDVSRVLMLLLAASINDLRERERARERRRESESESERASEIASEREREIARK